MAITPLKPKSLQDVLAEQTKVVTPTTAPAPVSSTASINQAKLAENQAKAAEREAARKQNNMLENYGTGYIMDERDSGDGYVNKGVQYQVQSGSDFYIAPTKSEAESLASVGASKKPTIVGGLKTSVPKTDIGGTTRPRVQVGKLVSDFQGSLKSSKGDKAKYYEGINYNALSEDEKKQADNFFKMREDAKKKLVDKKLGEMDIYDKYKTDTEKGVEKQSEVTEKGREEALAAKEAEKNIMIADYDTRIAEEEASQAEFVQKQNELLSGYESNRLNQVQGDIRRALLARGVDISKIPQEQLIALSGEIGSKAFSDIFSAKERATNAIENARQAKLARVQQLRTNKALTEAQYKGAVANINSVADQAKLNNEMKGIEVVFGIKQAQETKKETTETGVVQAIANMAGYLGLSGTQLKDLYAVAGGAKTVADAVNRITAEVQNTSSPIYSSMKSNQAATKAAADFKNKLEALKVQADLLRAQKSGGSGKSGAGDFINPDAQ